MAAPIPEHKPVRQTAATISAKLMLAACVAAACLPWLAAAQEQYPKPLLHTPTNHPAARVLLLSIDGLHALDLALWVAQHPHSALAGLSRRGVTYTNAHTPVAYPAAGLAALVTGGTPISTGLIADDGFDHALSPPGSNCRQLGASFDLNGSLSDGRQGNLAPATLPLDPHNGCAPVPPHALLRVNTIFEVVHDKLGHTAWAGESAASTDLLRGPSGQGLDQACPAATDAARAAIVLHWIDGHDCTGARAAPVPTLFGMSFTAIATAQQAPGAGYTDAIATPSPALAASLAATDATIARIVRELKATQLYDSTWIFIVSPFGSSPMTPITSLRRRYIDPARLRAVADTLQPNLIAHISGGDVAMLWLNDPSQTTALAKALGDRAATLGIQEVVSGALLALTLNPPAKDSRTPDILLQPAPGVFYLPPGDTPLASHGGALDPDTHVALLVSGAQLTGRTDPTWVPTTQLAALLLRALGLEKFDLRALHLEHSPALPGIF